MGVVKTRGAARKLGPIGLGRHFTTFKIKDCDRHFAIHEDLISSNSNMFKKRLQKNRKAIEGLCSICHEDLDRKMNDITFCTAQCGQNVHIACLIKWRGSHPNGDLTCPMCREVWQPKIRNQLIPIAVNENLDPTAVQLYIDWLYTGQIHIEDDGKDKDKFNVQLLKAWKVSSILEDEKFRHAIVAEYLSSVEAGENQGFGLESIAYAFEEADMDLMRGFVVDCLVTTLDEVWYSENQDWLYDEFKNMFISAAVRRLNGKGDVGELLKEYTNGEYEMEGEVEVEN